MPYTMPSCKHVCACESFLQRVLGPSAETLEETGDLLAMAIARCPCCSIFVQIRLTTGELYSTGKHCPYVQFWHTSLGGLGPTFRHLEIEMPNEFAVCDVLGNLVFLRHAQPLPQGFFEPLLLRELFAEPLLLELFAEPLLRELFAEPLLRELFAKPLLRELFAEPLHRELFAEPLHRGLSGYAYAFHIVSQHFVLRQTWTTPLL